MADELDVLNDRIADLENRLICIEEKVKHNKGAIRHDRKRMVALSLGIVGLVLAIQGIDPTRRSETIQKIVDQALPVVLGVVSAGLTFSGEIKDKP